MDDSVTFIKLDRLRLKKRMKIKPSSSTNKGQGLKCNVTES